MSETETPDTDESTDQEEPEQPSIDEGEMADLDSIAEEVEADAGAGDQDGEGDVDDQEDADLDLDEDADRTSIGDVYCNVLGMTAVTAKDRYGSGLDKDRKDALEELAEIARDLEIDAAVDDLIEQYGGPDQLTPGQTVIVMTIVWGGMVAMEDPEILEGLADEGGPA